MLFFFFSFDFVPVLNCFHEGLVKALGKQCAVIGNESTQGGAMWPKAIRVPVPLASWSSSKKNASLFESIPARCHAIHKVLFFTTMKANGWTKCLPLCKSAYCIQIWQSIHSLEIIVWRESIPGCVIDIFGPKGPSTCVVHAFTWSFSPFIMPLVWKCICV